MNVRSFLLNAIRAVVALAALALVYLTPVVAVSSTGARSYDLTGIAIDLVALIVVALVAVSAWRSRPKNAILR